MLEWMGLYLALVPLTYLTGIVGVPVTVGRDGYHMFLAYQISVKHCKCKISVPRHPVSHKNLAQIS